MTTINGASETGSEPKLTEKSIQSENKRLKNEIKTMEAKTRALQSDLKKSNQLKSRLEGLCRELQKQNRYIKAESAAKIQEANEKGKELAQEVQNNMGFMKNINDNLSTISSESLKVKKENEELAQKIAVLKEHYEEREKVLQSALTETNTGLIQAKKELGEFKIKSTEERQKLMTEMKTLAEALMKSHDQIQEAKQTEIDLREIIRNYDEKFNKLQKAMKDTNSAYEEFRTEMNKVTSRTKDLEKETTKWQNRWEESNTALTNVKKSHIKLQSELVQAEENLTKMKNLCRALQNERKELLEEIKNKSSSNDCAFKEKPKSPVPPPSSSENEEKPKSPISPPSNPENEEKPKSPIPPPSSPKNEGKAKSPILPQSSPRNEGNPKE